MCHLKDQKQSGTEALQRGSVVVSETERRTSFRTPERLHLGRERDTNSS